MIESSSDYEYIVTPREWNSVKLSESPSNMVENLTQTHELYTESETDRLDNCTYLYDFANSGTVDIMLLYLDGPMTIFFAILALIGGRLAVKFLDRARLNKDLTSALYVLCFCDSLLIIFVVIYHSIEATGLVLINKNPMWNQQGIVVFSHGLVSALTTSSTLLVVHISFQRFLVVFWPLKYSKINHRRNDTSRSTFRKVSQHEAESTTSMMRRCNSSVAKNPPQAVCNRKDLRTLIRNVRPFVFPASIMLLGFILNLTVFFEFELKQCYAFEQNTISTQFYPTGLRSNQTYNSIRTLILMLTQTIGPILVISLLTIITEFKVHSSLKARRKLIEGQQRRRSLVQMEEMKEKLSRFVAIFIATKFIILRSLPVFLDLYEVVHGIDFDSTFSLLVRISDFGVVLNTATNTLAYFGKAGFLENTLKKRLKAKTSNTESPSVAPSKKSMMLTINETSSVTLQLVPENA